MDNCVVEISILHSWRLERPVVFDRTNDISRTNVAAMSQERPGAVECLASTAVLAETFADAKTGLGNGPQAKPG